MILLIRATLLLAAGLAFSAAVRAEKPDDKKPKVEFRLAEDKPAKGLREMTVEGTKQKVYLHETTALTSADVASAQATADPMVSGPLIEIRFTEGGAKKLGKLTEENIGRHLAILVDDKVITAPKILAKIGGRAVVSGRFTKAEAGQLAKAISGN